MNLVLYLLVSFGAVYIECLDVTLGVVHDEVALGAEHSKSHLVLNTLKSHLVLNTMVLLLHLR